MKKRKRWRVVKWLSLLVGFSITLYFGVLFLGHHQIDHFKRSDQAEFYVVSYDGITGYRIENGQSAPVVENKVGIIREGMNPIVLQAELLNRYLVFSEDGWPTGKTEGVISIDFEEGTVEYQKTKHSAWTSAGETENYYFAMVAGGENFISVYTPQLEEKDHLILDHPAMMVNDFTADAKDTFWAISTDVESTVNENGYHDFTNRLLKGSVQDGKLSLELIKELEKNPDRQYWFNDTVYKGNYLYCTCQGWRNLATFERNVEGWIYRYNLVQETGEFFPLEEVAPEAFFELDDNLFAIRHSQSSSTQFGFTLFDGNTGESTFVNLEELGVDRDSNEDQIMDLIMDIKPLNSRQLLLLMQDKLLLYNLDTDSLVSQFPLKDVNTAFHIWIVQ